jgi:hypothetical protein
MPVLVLKDGGAGVESAILKGARVESAILIGGSGHTAPILGLNAVCGDGEVPETSQKPVNYAGILPYLFIQQANQQRNKTDQFSYSYI